MTQPTQPHIYGQTDLTYNEYLKVKELLSLQVQQSDPPHHDEMLFIIIHQAYELWFKLILAELGVAMKNMREQNVLRAHHFMKRVVEVMKLLVGQIHILETMTPIEFLEFRDRLMPASGFQSSQFREIEFKAGLKEERYLQYFKNKPEMIETLKRQLAEPDLRDEYFALLKKLGLKVVDGAAKLESSANFDDRIPNHQALIPIYQNPTEHLPLYLLSESLIDFDQYLALWREHHVRVVERVIGFKKGSGGSSGAEYLRATLSKKCFPSLWEVRTALEKRK
jgi:tryptophan 2,3-dioxygenase